MSKQETINQRNFEDAQLKAARAETYHRGVERIAALSDSFIAETPVADTPAPAPTPAQLNEASLGGNAVRMSELETLKQAVEATYN